MSRARNLGDIAGVSYISAANNKIGIGTTNPQYTLDVIGDINFYGSLNQNGSVFIASSVTANSVGLGTYTYGDYVKDITGTANQITITGGTGEGSSPTLSVPNQFTAPQDVTVSRDLQVNRNLNVNGNITIGGTAATLFTTEFKVYDPDIVLGFRTDGSGNDISTDNTANHGGIAIASTEGTPLISLYDVGVGETNPATYKKIMWFKSGTFSGLGTDAWISNYAIGIGSTQVPDGARLTAGGMQVTDTSISSPQINISGLSTFTNGPILVGTSSSTGTSSQPLQVTGGAYVSGNVGIGTTNPQYALDVTGDINFNGSLNQNGSTFVASRWSSGIGNDIYRLSGDVGIGTTNPQYALDVAGDINFTGTFRQNGSQFVASRWTSGTGDDIYRLNGNVGVGTTNPTEKLQIIGNANVSGIVTAASFSGDGSSLSGIAAAKGGGTDKIFFENDQEVTADYTISTSKNAMSAGPVGIATGITVTIPSGSTWTIV